MRQYINKRYKKQENKKQTIGMSLVFNIAKNTFYQVVGKVIGTIIGLITIGMMTRYLGQTGFGYYTTIIAFLQFFGVLVDFGLQMTTNQMISKPGADEQKIVNNAFTLRFISSFVFLGLAVTIGFLAPYPMIVKWGIGIASFSFFFISLQSVLISVFQKKMNMAKVAIAEVWGRVVLLIGVYLAIFEQAGLLIIIVAVVLGSFVNFSILLFGSLKYFPMRFRFDFAIWRKIWKVTWPLAMTIGLTLVYFRADTIIMSFFRPANEVGIYGATYKVVEVLVQFPYLFLGLILPLLTNFFVRNRKLFEVTFQKTFEFITIITVPMVLATIVLGDKIMIFIAGPEFAISGGILKILILAVAAIFWGAFFGYTIVACELQKKMIKFYIFDAVLSLILYLIFIPLYTYWAAAILTVLTETIIMVSAYYILKKHVRVALGWRILGKSILAGVVMMAALYIMINFHIITLVIVGLIVYFWALYMLKGVSKQNVMEVINMRKM